MKANWKAILAAMAIVGMVGLQPQVVLGEDASGSTIHKKAKSVVSEQDATGNAVNKKSESMATENGVAEKKVETVTFDLMPNHVAEDMAMRKFLQEKKASFVEGDEESLELVGTTFTAKRIPELVITDTFVNALKEEAKARVEAKQREPWVFPDVDVLKEKLEAIGKKKPVDTHASEMLDADGADDADDVTDVDTTRKKDSTSVGHDSLEAPSEVENTAEKDSSETAKESNHSKADSTVDHKVSDKVKKPIEDKKDSKDAKQSKAPKYPIDLLWTDKATIFLHEDVHVGATRSEVLFAWGAPQAMWRDNKDGSLLWLYQGVFGEEKTITKNKKNSMQKEEFSHSVKNTYTSDSLAGSNSSVGYVWLSLKHGKVTHLGMITGQDWPRFAIPATTLETFKPNTMTESDFSLMGYRLGDTFTNDPNRSWEERGKLYGQEFLGYKDVVIAYNKEHEITRVMINSSLGTTKRGISLGDSKYLLLYLYGVPDFEEPANHHDSTKGVVYGYRHPVLEHTYLLFTLDDKFIREILLSNQKKSELVSAMNPMALR